MQLWSDLRLIAIPVAAPCMDIRGRTMAGRAAETVARCRVERMRECHGCSLTTSPIYAPHEASG